MASFPEQGRCLNTQAKPLDIGSRGRSNRLQRSKGRAGRVGRTLVKKAYWFGLTTPGPGKCRAPNGRGRLRDSDVEGLIAVVRNERAHPARTEPRPTTCIDTRRGSNRLSRVCFHVPETSVAHTPYDRADVRLPVIELEALRSGLPNRTVTLLGWSIWHMQQHRVMFHYA